MLSSPGSLVWFTAAAPCQLCFERVEALAPLPAQFGEPALDALERLAVQRVEPTGAFGAHVGKAAFPEHAQLPRDSRLRKSELRPHDRDYVTGAALAGGQQLEDAPPDGVAEDVEGLHENPI
jgi:hypothetical protein